LTATSWKANETRPRRSIFCRVKDSVV